MLGLIGVTENECGDLQLGDKAVTIDKEGAGHWMCRINKVTYCNLDE
jgi:hypothetical protein